MKQEEKIIPNAEDFNAPISRGDLMVFQNNLFEKLDKRYVSKNEFLIVKSIVYGGAILILKTFGEGLINLVKAFGGK